nr:NUDIX domain-containing protein [Streptomyces benahoarensis]
MTPARSTIRALVHAYLAHRPAERPALKGLLAALDAQASEATPPGRLTCSAVVIDRARRVLHLRRRSDGGRVSLPGGPMEPDDATPLAAALRGLGQETGLRPGDLCLTPQLGGTPIDIGVHGTDAAVATGSPAPAHRRYDIDVAFVLQLAHDTAPEIVVREEEVTGVEWRRSDEVGPPTLRAKLHGGGVDGHPQPVHSSALLHDGEGRYLLHLRDNRPGIRQPGAWGLLGGGREPQDRSLLDTVRRELAEEAPGIGPLALEPFAVEKITGADGLCVPVQIYTGRWNGDADRVGLAEGVMLRWFTPEVLHRLVLTDSTRELVFRHAAEPGTGALARSEAGAGAWVADAVRLPGAERPVGDSVAATVGRLAGRFTAHDTARGLSAVEQWTLQVLKISEETGEAAQALIGARGTNPRKAPVPWEEVHAEVADVVITALVALKRMRPDDAEDYLRHQLALKTAKFLPGPAASPETWPPSPLATDRPGSPPS